MVEAYWLLVKGIIEEYQKGKSKAEYGEEMIQMLSRALTTEIADRSSLGLFFCNKGQSLGTEFCKHKNIIVSLQTNKNIKK